MSTLDQEFLDEFKKQTMRAIIWLIGVLIIGAILFYFSSSEAINFLIQDQKRLRSKQEEIYNKIEYLRESKLDREDFKESIIDIKRSINRIEDKLK